MQLHRRRRDAVHASLHRDIDLFGVRIQDFEVCPAWRVIGEAHADIRTLFALITPDEVNQSWVKNVVPHELTPLVFNTAVDNPYHAPPHWFNEGLAVWSEQQSASGHEGNVSSAADAGQRRIAFGQDDARQVHVAAAAA